jgi:nucleoid-associated protein YgaU
MLARAAGGPAPVVTTPTAPRGAAPAAPAQPPGVRIHTVVAGDSLSRLSQRYYGTANRWQEIYNANADKLGPNGVLRIGTELRIP